MKFLKNKKNYKILIGLIIGIVAVIIVKQITNNKTYSLGAYLGNGNDLTYDNTSSGLTSTTVQGALDELYQAKQTASSGGCPSNYVCIPMKTPSLGDYVHYVPEKSTASIAGERTGYDTNSSGSFTASVQTFTPNELTSWRVININGDGSVEIISAKVSSATIYFAGLTGYLNFVGALNEMACEYTRTGVTSGCRHFGYSNQTQTLSTGSQFTTAGSAPWECNTGGSCSPAPVENQGGGDTGYLTDYNQLETAFNTGSTASAAKAYKHGTTTYTTYLVASRYYGYNKSTVYSWGGRIVNTGGTVNGNYLYTYNSGFIYGRNVSALRPIVTLKSGLSYIGVGTADNPLEIVS